MTIIAQDPSQFFVRFDKGEDVIEKLIELAKAHTISGATFTAIGASEKVVLAYYDLKNKQYLDRAITENLEITGITGSIALIDGTPIIHAHGTFADDNYTVRGGHIKSLIVSATCEVALTLLTEPIYREYDEVTGLNLLKNTST